MEQQPTCAPGEQVTVLLAAEAITVYERAPGHRFLHIRIGGHPAYSVDIPLTLDAVKVIHGDITPTLEHMAADAISYHDEGACGVPGHEELVCQYERLADGAGLVLASDGRPVLTAAPPPPDPG